MKIAVISDRVYPYFKGGAEKRTWDIASFLTKKGYEFHFYTGQWPGMKRDEIIDGIHLHGVYKVGNFYVNGKKSIIESLLYTIKLFPVLLKADFDVIDCDQFPLIHILTVKLISILRKKRFILTWCEVWDKYWFKYIGWKGVFGYLIEKIVTQFPDNIVSISKHTTNRLISQTKINPSKIVTIPVGIDIENIVEVKPSKNKSDIIFVGRLLSHKKVDILINSVQLVKNKYPNVKCLIIGDGPEKENLITLTEDLDLNNNVDFLGFIENHNDIYSHMKSSKVFVLPSTREGFGIVVIEANACGIPVITVNHKDNAARDLIEEGKNGFVCQLNEEEIAKRIIRILINNSGREMQKVCISLAKKYDWDKIVNEIEGVYEDGIK